MSTSNSTIKETPKLERGNSTRSLTSNSIVTKSLSTDSETLDLETKASLVNAKGHSDHHRLPSTNDSQISDTDPSNGRNCSIM